MATEEIFVDAESEEKINEFKERENDRLRKIEFQGKNMYDEARKFWASPNGKKAIREAREVQDRNI